MWALDGPYEGPTEMRDASAAWKWNLSREDREPAETVVYISRTAETASIAAETAEAIRTRGRSAVVKALEEDPENPPAAIVCGTQGCRTET